MTVRTTYFWTLKVNLESYTALVRKYKLRDRLVGDDAFNLSTARVVDEVIPLDYLHHYIEDHKIEEFSTEEDANMCVQMTVEPEWYVSPWYVSGVFSGYRVVRHLPGGQQEVSKGFAYDRYSGESSDSLKAEAEAHCKKVNS